MVFSLSGSNFVHRLFTTTLLVLLICLGTISTFTQDGTAEIIIDSYTEPPDETETGSISLRLNQTPTSEVVLGIRPRENNCETNTVTFSPSQITFTPGDWNEVQTITVIPTNDTFASNFYPFKHQCQPIIETQNSLSAPEFANLSVQINSFQFSDDDPLFLVSGDLDLEEDGGPGQITVLQNTRDDVVAGFRDDDLNIYARTDQNGVVQVRALAYSLDPVDVVYEITPVDDADFTNETVTVTIDVDVEDRVGTGAYRGIFRRTVNIADAAQIITELASSTIVEGETTTMEVRLEDEPTSEVVITPESSSNVDYDPSSLTFTPQNWNQNQTLNVTARKDTAEGNQTVALTVRGTALTGQNEYTDQTAQVDLTILDTDLDTDGDGVSDYQEGLENTDPNDPANFLDSDDSGVPDAVEVANGLNPNDPADDSGNNLDNDGLDFGTEDGDRNGDGINDGFQPNVATLLSPLLGGPSTLAVTGGPCQNITGYRLLTQDMATVDEGYDYPAGLHSYSLLCEDSGSAAEVTIYLDQMYETEEVIGRFYDAPSGEYLLCPESLVIGTALVAQTEVTTLRVSTTDGLPGDQTGMSDGVINQTFGLGIARLEEIQGSEVSDSVTTPTVPTLIRTGGYE